MKEQRMTDEELASFITAAESHLHLMRQLIEGSRVFIRSSDYRDVIFGAHLSRITTTCQSVFHLCRIGNSHDAEALCRVILEHYVSLIYLVTHRDAVKATQGFVVDSLTHVGQSHLNAAKHYPDRFSFNPEKALEAIEIGKSARYENRFHSQLESLRSTYSQTHLDWFKELIYGDLSISTHPHVSGLDPFAPDLAEQFRLRRPSLPERNASAAVLSWALTESAYIWIAAAWGLSWGEDLVAAGVALLDNHPNIQAGISVGISLPDLPSPPPNLPTKKTKNKKPPANT